MAPGGELRSDHARAAWASARAAQAEAHPRARGEIRRTFPLMQVSEIRGHCEETADFRSQQQVPGPQSVRAPLIKGSP